MRISNPFNATTESSFLSLPSTPRTPRTKPSRKPHPNIRLSYTAKAPKSPAHVKTKLKRMTKRERRATKAALALHQLILDPLCPNSPTRRHPPATSHHTSPTKPASTVSRLREKDIDRLKSQLLRSDEAGLVISRVRNLHDGTTTWESHSNAVCLECDEQEAEHLITTARRAQKSHQAKIDQIADHPFSTLKSNPNDMMAPRLPQALSLMKQKDDEGGLGVTMFPLGLFQPASAMSLGRPLAGALPSAETLRVGFEALLNAESKIYLYEGPSHKGINPPQDRLSVFTYWWGFELALPPPTMAYLDKSRTIGLSILNLLGVLVYAVPGGARELGPFIGVLSRFIETEWAVLKAQDQGEGVVCGATWFIPAAIVARPWDSGGDKQVLT